MKDVNIAEGTAVFVDRDGTLNHDRGYVTAPDQLELIAGVPEAVARLNRLGVKVIMVTNQSAIGRGLMTQYDLEKIHERLAMQLQPFGASVDAVFSCPHHPRDECACRKPRVGLIQEAVDRYALDVSHCYLVGDKHSDLAAAQQAGVPGILVMTSSYAAAAVKARDEGALQIAYVAENFAQAVAWIEEDLIRRAT